MALSVMPLSLGVMIGASEEQAPEAKAAVRTKGRKSEDLMEVCMKQLSPLRVKGTFSTS
ncbi:MAG: hypothetical protein IPF99_32215 [Deltaproteobacteria bacterium]|nr:hypothetical protein [Deltaproteobacteria bacterium]